MLAYWAGLHIALFKARDRLNLAVIARTENFIGRFQVCDGYRAFMDIVSIVPQETDNPLARYPVQKCAVRDGRIDGAIADRKKVCRRELRYIADGIAKNCIVETPVRCFAQCATGIRIKARCLGVGWRHVGCRAPARRKTGRDPGRGRQRGMINDNCKTRTFRVRVDPAIFGPEHRTNVKFRIIREPAHAFQCQCKYFVGGMCRL